MSRTRARLRPRSEHGHKGRTRKENMMAKYLLLKHYRGGPAPTVDWAPMDQWTGRRWTSGRRTRSIRTCSSCATSRPGWRRRASSSTPRR
jgi:hypothetical protein